MGWWWLSLGFARPLVAEGCHLTIEPAPGLHDLSSADADACLHIGTDRDNDDVHLEVHFVPRGQKAPRALGDWARVSAREFHILDLEEVRFGDVSYGTVDGRPSAWVDFFGNLGGAKIRGRSEVIDAPLGLTMLTTYGWSLAWGGWEHALASMRASVTLERSAEPVPWKDQPHLEPLGQPPVEARAASGLTPPHDALAGRAVSEGMAAPLVNTTYPADGVQRVAFVSPPIQDAEPRPAVIWVEGTPAGPMHAWQRGPLFDDRSLLDLLDQPLVVFVPLLRGQHGEAGGVEYLWGETDDLLAAVEHVRSMPGVDPARVYLVGQGLGGTQALLAAAAGAPVAATIAVEAPTALTHGSFDRLATPPAVSRSEPEALRLRSPLAYAAHLDRPVSLFASRNGWLGDAYALAQASDQVQVVGMGVGRPSMSFAPVTALLADVLPEAPAGTPLPLTHAAAQEQVDAMEKVFRTQWKRRTAKEIDEAAEGWCHPGKPLVLWFTDPGCAPCEAVRQADLRGVLEPAFGSRPPLAIDSTDRREIDHLIEAFALYDLPEALVVRTDKCSKPLRKWQLVRHVPVPDPPTDEALRAWWRAVKAD